MYIHSKPHMLVQSTKYFVLLHMRYWGCRGRFQPPLFYAVLRSNTSKTIFSFLLYIYIYIYIFSFLLFLVYISSIFSLSMFSLYTCVCVCVCNPHNPSLVSFTLSRNWLLAREFFHNLIHTLFHIFHLILQVVQFNFLKIGVGGCVHKISTSHPPFI